MVEIWDKGKKEWFINRSWYGYNTKGKKVIIHL